VPWCHNHGILDPFAYDLRQGVECLCAVQDYTALCVEETGKAQQHATFKNARAAMSAMWTIACPGTNFAEDPAVKAIAVGLRREVPCLARYEDTWDVNLVFDRIFALAEAKTPIIALPHAKKRAWVALLLKLKTKCRTGDLAPNKQGRGGVFRRYVQQDKLLFGLQGDHVGNTVKQVRFYLNKTTISRPSSFSKWHRLGDYLRPTDAFPHLGDACPRAMLETYLDETDGLPRADHYLFTSATKTKSGKHARITASRLANCIVGVLRECGVPERFKGHSTRHATLSAGADDPMTDLDTMLGAADLSSKVFRLYYSREVAEDAKAARKERQSSAALAAMLTGHQSHHKKWVRDGSDAQHAEQARREAGLHKFFSAADDTVKAAAAAAASQPEGEAKAQAKAKPKAQPKRKAKRKGKEAAQDEEFEVEAILDARHDLALGVKVFVVKWKGFEELTWEPRANLGNSRALLREFERARSKLKIKRPVISHFDRILPADPASGRPATVQRMMRKRALKSQSYFTKLPPKQRSALLRAMPSSDDSEVVPLSCAGADKGKDAPASAVEPPLPTKVCVDGDAPTAVVEPPTPTVIATRSPIKPRRFARGSVRAAASRPQASLGGRTLLQYLHGDSMQGCGRSTRASRSKRAKPSPKAESPGAWFGTGVPQPNLPRGRQGALRATPSPPAHSSEFAADVGLVSPDASVGSPDGDPEK